MGRNQYWAGRVYDLCVYYMTGTPEGSTESGFMEKLGIEPATSGLQGIALIHYTTGGGGGLLGQIHVYVLLVGVSEEIFIYSCIGANFICLKKSAYFGDYAFDHSNGEYQINTSRFHLLDGYSDISTNEIFKRLSLIF